MRFCKWNILVRANVIDDCHQWAIKYKNYRVKQSFIGKYAACRCAHNNSLALVNVSFLVEVVRYILLLATLVKF